MNRTFLIAVAGLVAAALFGGLVHIVLTAANLAEPAATTVYGVTLRRAWATAIAALALAGVLVGATALARPTGWLGTASGRSGGLVALMAGSLAVVNGVLNLRLATGGPGTGNGVVGAAGAVVLGVIALALGAVALARAARPGLTG